MSEVLTYGQYEVDKTDQEILSVLLDSESEVGMNGTDITKQVSVSNSTVSNHLPELVEAGLVGRQKTGTGRVPEKKNFLTDEGKEFCEEHRALIQTPSEMDELRRQFADIQQSVDELSSLRAEVDDLQGAWGAKKGKVNQLIEDLRETVGSFEELSQERHELIEATEELEGVQEEVKAEADDQLSRIEQKGEKLQNDIDATRSDIEDKLNEQFNEVQEQAAEVETLRDEVENIKAEIEEKERESNDRLIDAINVSESLRDDVERLELALEAQGLSTIGDLEGETVVIKNLPGEEAPVKVRREAIDEQFSELQFPRRKELNTRMQMIEQFLDRIDAPEGETKAEAAAEAINKLIEKQEEDDEDGGGGFFG